MRQPSFLRTRWPRRRRYPWLLAGGVLSALTLIGGAAVVPTMARPRSSPGSPRSIAASGSAIRHVVVIDLDNTHLADMLAMPAVRSWFTEGTVMANDHTDLVSYTHPDYVNEVTGLYDSRTGIMSNFQYDAGQGLSFSYWLDTLSNGSPTHLSAPPWKWWNSHGYSVGAVGWADIELESASEVSQYVTVAPGYSADNYLGFAVHRADGTTVFGLPNAPYVMDAKLLADPSQTVGVHSGGWDSNFGPDRSLTEAAALLTHGVPVVFDYIRTVHNSPTTGNSLTPGTPAYRANLDHYNTSFAAFFSDLKAHGMTPANTLVVMTSDEGDHFNPGGEIETSAPAWFTRVGLPTSSLTIDGSAANLVYWPPGTTVDLHDLAQMPGWRYLVWGSALKAIHVATAVPADNPELVQFAEPAWYYNYSGSSTALTTNSEFLWNHGNVDRGVNSLWASFVGPGVPAGQTSRQWVDSTGLLPTIQRLVSGRVEPGLDGVVMQAAVAQLGRPHSGQDQAQPAQRLAVLTSTYEELNAPLGVFGRDAMEISTTAALEPGRNPGFMSQLDHLVSERTPVAAALHHAVVQADDGTPVSEAQAKRLVHSATALLGAIQALADQALIR
jgi:hypothetical protein